MKTRRQIPSQLRLNTLFTYDGEKLIWNTRSISEFVTEHAWKKWNTRYANKSAGCITHDGAIQINIEGRAIYAHRIIYKMITGLEPSHLDHKDLDKLNNKFENLRPTDDSSNGCNVSSHNSIGLKNVFYMKDRRKPWFVSVGKNGKYHFGGTFSTKEQAFEAACKLREKLHGDFCRHE